MIVKTVTKKSTKKKIANDDDAGKEDDETTDDEMKVIPVPEKSDIDGIVASAPKAKKNAKASGSQLATMSSFSGSAWTDEQLLSELQHIDQQTCTNIIQLFNDDNTIPFMCRYRRELIGDLSPDQWVDLVKYWIYEILMRFLFNLNLFAECVTLKSPIITFRIYEIDHRTYWRIWKSVAY